MWALHKEYRKLTPGQRGALAEIAAVNKPLYKGCLIKEQLRQAFKAKGEDGKKPLRAVTAWAKHRRIPEFAARQASSHSLSHAAWPRQDIMVSFWQVFSCPNTGSGAGPYLVVVRPRG